MSSANSQMDPSMFLVVCGVSLAIGLGITYACGGFSPPKPGHEKYCGANTCLLWCFCNRCVCFCPVDERPVEGAQFVDPYAPQIVYDQAPQLVKYDPPNMV